MLHFAGALLTSSLVVLALGAGRASAQGNDLDAPAGGRSTLMGDTGVALGRDGKAPFNNPATIVTILDRRLAFSVNFYSLAFTSFERWHQPGDVDASLFGDAKLGGTGLLNTSFQSLPSILCLFFTLEQLAAQFSGDKRDKRKADSASQLPIGKKLAVCFGTMETEDVDMEAIAFRGDTAAGPTTQVQSLKRRWGRTYIGPTYSVSLNDHFAIGGSLHVVYSRTSFGIDSDSISARANMDSAGTTLGTDGRGKSFELTGMLGMTYRLDRTTFGASLRLPSLHILGTYDGTFQRANTGDPDVSLITTAHGSMQSAPPVRLALGAGVMWDRWTLELNAALTLPLQSVLKVDVESLDTELGAPTGGKRNEKYSVPSHVTFNPSFGFEYFVNSGLSLLGGVSANFTALSALEPMLSVGNIVQARMSHLAASFGIGSYWEHGELLFGLQFDYGWGEALAVNPYIVPNAWSVVSTQTYKLLFVIAGATSFRAITHIVDKIANGDEGEKPARPDTGSAKPPPQTEDEKKAR